MKSKLEHLEVLVKRIKSIDLEDFMFPEDYQSVIWEKITKIEEYLQLIKKELDTANTLSREVFDIKVSEHNPEASECYAVIKLKGTYIVEKIPKPPIHLLDFNYESEANEVCEYLNSINRMKNIGVK